MNLEGTKFGKPRLCPCEVSWCVGPDLAGDVCMHCLETWVVSSLTTPTTPSKDDLVDNLLRIALEMRGTADAHLVGAAATNLRNAIRDRDEHLRGKNELVARVYRAEDRVNALEAVLRQIVDSVDKGILDARAFAWHARNALDGSGQ